MALIDTSQAIGAVSSLLKERIDAISGLTTSVGRPSETTDTAPHLNLFLYEIHLDEHLKNTPLNEGETPPLWLVLKYLLTAYETAKDSDSENAHLHLGAGLRAIATEDLLRLQPTLSAAILDALSPNPSPLHVSFDEATADLAAKLMQGPDDKIRLSACFQVRPVMIASAEPGDYSLLVGVDYTQPPLTLADPYVGIDVIPSMGPRIEEISPRGFELGEEVTLRGTDMHLANLSVMLGTVELPVIMQRPDELRFRVDAAIINASGISAGSYPVSVAMTLPGTGKKRRSNAVVGNLVPTVSAVLPNVPPPPVVAPNTVTVNVGPPRTAFARIDLTGVLLGTAADDVILAFYRDGAVVRMFDVLAFPAAPAQTAVQLVMTAGDALPAGDYNMILIVNGQQAPQSPIVHLDTP